MYKKLLRNYVRTNSRTKTKPVTAPTVKPSRRNNPFTIEPDTMPQVPPKASDDSFNNNRIMGDLRLIYINKVLII
jgi:hypothetical protein